MAGAEAPGAEDTQGQETHAAARNALRRASPWRQGTRSSECGTSPTTCPSGSLWPAPARQGPGSVPSLSCTPLTRSRRATVPGGVWVCSAGDTWQCLDTCFAVTTRQRLVCGGLGRCSPSRAAPGTVPTTNAGSAPHVSSAEVETPTRGDASGLRQGRKGARVWSLQGELLVNGRGKGRRRTRSLLGRMCVHVCKGVRVQASVHARLAPESRANQSERGLSFSSQDSQLFARGIIRGGRSGLRKGPGLCPPSQKRRGVYTKKVWSHICGPLQLIPR